MINIVKKNPCTENITSLIRTGLTPPGCNEKYSPWIYGDQNKDKLNTEYDKYPRKFIRTIFVLSPFVLLRKKFCTI